MHLSTIAAASLLTLAALTPAEANAQRDTYRAQGTEPLWSLSIDARTMRFETPDRRPLTVAKPKVIHGFAGEIYRTPRIGVNIVHKECIDPRSRRVHPDTVTVTARGQTWQGCGGEVRADHPGAAIDGSWSVRSIDGKPVARGTAPTVSFAGSRISGNTGCNSFSGTYRFERGRLQAGALAATKRGCIGRGIDEQEQRLLRLLGGPLSVSRSRSGQLVMTAPGGQTLVLSRGP